MARLLTRAGYAMLLVDYRGYGGSGGSPSEAGIYRDGEAALRYLRGRPDVDPARIVLWGRSIGAVVAVRVAAAEAVAPADPSARPAVLALVLESGFTSALDLLREGGHWTIYPLALLGSYRFDVAARIGSVRAPVLVVHGTDDEVVPFRLGRRLYDLAPGRKEFLAIDRGGHNDLIARHARELWDGVARFLRTLE